MVSELLDLRAVAVRCLHAIEHAQETGSVSQILEWKHDDLAALTAEVERLRQFEAAVRDVATEAGSIRRPGEPLGHVARWLWTQVGDALKALDDARGGDSHDA